MPPIRRTRRRAQTITDEATAWYTSIYKTVQLIPKGRVTTYGHIAFLLGRPECPRQVGTALKHLPLPSESTEFNSDTVPWQRVISASGKISDRHDGGEGRARQAEKLREEGILVSGDEERRSLVGRRMEKWGVSVEEYGWFPREVPREVEPKVKEEEES